MIVCCTMGIAH